jgi:hypothetical protein
MNFEKNFPHDKIVTRQRAVTLGRAANTLEGVKVKVLDNEGEDYRHFHDGLGIERSEIVHGKVEAGHEHIEITPASAAGELDQAADDFAEAHQELAA